MLSQKSFKSYIHRVLKNTNPSINITSKAIECTDGVLRTVACALSNSAHLFTQGTDKKTLSALEVQSATRIVFPTNMAKLAIDEGTKATTKFQASLNESKSSKTEDKTAKPLMRESRAGLLFSVSLAEKYLRGFGQIRYNITGGAPVYLAAVLEHVTKTMCSVASAVCREHKRTNITVRHLFLAVNRDEDMVNLMKRLRVVILGGGVIPNINDRLLVKKPKKAIRREKPVDGEGKRVRRWRPGTVALREIKNHQKNSELLMQHAPFERVVRELAGRYNPKLRFTSQFMVAFQNLVEHDLTTMLSVANELGCHANRETLDVKDIDLAVKILSLPNTPVENLENDVPTAAMNKLAYRAGVKRIGMVAKTRAKEHFCTLVNYYLNYVVSCAEHNRRQTINTKFLLEGLAMVGIHLTTVPEKRKTAKKVSKNSEDPTSDAESVYDPREASEVSKVENKSVAKGDDELVIDDVEDDEPVLDEIEEDEDELFEED